ncbi:Rieske (2Fe-2S) protein [Streptomyces beihaiensis]|uniref:Cytochrome bc1 complex Rieske iron-sulfur subunit n=1 Tax=Streptomyces beihaiensis TaxID=2984495 RepID=A0ABT3TRY4_9ACTN|nr:Rieske (2Fe-2S) protein [Streptomyces beihaiensis]MCX3058783.1 Rieske (2Fe-2S) protein [Streptomyces beihaiensis]
MSSSSSSRISRRTALRGAAVAGTAGLGLTACTAGSGGSGAGAAPTGPVDLGEAAEVPEGGAKLYRDEHVVVSRTRDGQYRAFSTICTHAGCPIGMLKGTELTCNCHGSKFDATTGKVLHSPATVPLTELSVKVEGGKIIAAPAQK